MAVNLVALVVALVCTVAVLALRLRGRGRLPVWLLVLDVAALLVAVVLTTLSLAGAG